MTIASVNDPPVLTIIGSPAAVEYSDLVEIGLSATDADGDAMSFAALGRPANLTLIDHNDGTATISGTIDESAGTYGASVSVSDGSSIEDASISVEVSPENATAAYTGDALVATAPGGSTASVRLAAQLVQEGDGHAGDLAGAAVVFELYRSANTALTVPDAMIGPVSADASGLAEISTTLNTDSWLVIVRFADGNGYFTGPPARRGGHGLRPDARQGDRRRLGCLGWRSRVLRTRRSEQARTTRCLRQHYLSVRRG